MKTNVKNAIAVFAEISEIFFTNSTTISLYVDE